MASDIGPPNFRLAQIIGCLSMNNFCFLIPVLDGSPLDMRVQQGLSRLFVFEGVVGGAYRLVEVVAFRWSLRRPVWMRPRMV